MKINRKGATRIVFVFDKIVIKIPNFTCQWDHFLMGLLSNIQENKLWKWNTGKFESGRSKYLCPVKWCSFGGWFLIMVKCDELIGDKIRSKEDLDSISKT